MKSIDESISNISFELSEPFRDKISNLGGAVISTAYVLAKVKKNANVSTNSLEEFIKTAKIDYEVSKVLSRNLTGFWDKVIHYIDRFDADLLENVVLYDNSFFKMSTPGCLANLAGRILECNENDSVLDICSGNASFPIYVNDTTINDYTGVEINYNLTDIAILRSSLLGQDYSFVINNALTYQYPTTYDKIFSNYPFCLKGPDIDECRRKLQEYFNLDSICISRCSSDWLFNATIIRAMKETGKAVAFMTNGAASSIPDMYIRQFFIENGYIEAVVNLPSSLFSDTSIPVTMVVFSHNNKSVRLINATNIFTKESRSQNTLSDENIQAVIDCINSGGENSIDLRPEDMQKYNYTLVASRYIEKPTVENGTYLVNLIKNITRGSQVKPDLIESYKSIKPTKYRYISLSNVSNGCIDIEEGHQYITGLPKALEKFVIPNNSIILTKMASPTFRSAVVNSDENHSFIATGNLYIIEVDENKADPYYIQAFFDSEKGETALNYVSGGSSVRTISVEAVKRIMIPLPALEEQKNIAQKYQATLDEYTVLKRKIQKVLERKRLILDREE